MPALVAAMAGIDDPGFYGDRWAAVYDDHHKQMDPGPAVEFLAGLAGDGRVLELAIGTGRVALPLAARGSAWKATRFARMKPCPRSGSLCGEGDSLAGIRSDACAPRVVQSRNLRDVWPCHQRRPQVQYQIRAGKGHGAPRRDRCPRVGVGVDGKADVVRGGDNVKIGDERAALPGAARADRAAER